MRQDDPEVGVGLKVPSERLLGRFVSPDISRTYAPIGVLGHKTTILLPRRWRERYNVFVPVGL